VTADYPSVSGLITNKNKFNDEKWVINDHFSALFFEKQLQSHME